MGQERIAFTTQLVPIVVRIDTKCDDGVEQPVEIGVGRSSETGWICRGEWRARVEKRCCGARDVKETVTEGCGELARGSEWRMSRPTLAQSDSSGGFDTPGADRGRLL